jgi:hypothetical protein
LYLLKVSKESVIFVCAGVIGVVIFTNKNLKIK